MIALESLDIVRGEIGARIADDLADGARIAAKCHRTASGHSPSGGIPNTS